MNVVPHVAQNTSGRRSAVLDAIANTEGYAVSQQKRKLIEQGFGWAKTVGGIRQMMVRSLQRVDQLFVLTCGCVQLNAHADLGTNPSARAIKELKRRQEQFRSVAASQKDAVI